MSTQATVRPQTMDQLREAIIVAIISELGVKREQVVPSARIEADLDAPFRLGLADLLHGLIDRFGLQVDEGERGAIINNPDVTVGDLTDFFADVLNLS
jgi:hypothetical protein